MTYSISDFPNLDDFSGGLIEIDPEDFNTMVSDFNNLISVRYPKQPSFFISKESWKLLANGQQKNAFGETINWLKDEFPDYEVYAFSFCLAFDLEYRRSTPPNEQYAYYRIRTIIKRKDGIPSDTVAVVVARDNIAYLKLAFGLGYGKSLRNDDLTFVDSTNTGLLNLIDHEVVVKQESATMVNPFNINIPKSFTIPYDSVEGIDILTNNEGSIIGRKAIWDNLLKTSNAEGTIVSIAFNKSKNTTIPTFEFSVDASSIRTFSAYEIDCPKPPGCQIGLQQ